MNESNMGSGGVFRAIQESQGLAERIHDLTRKATERMSALKRFLPLILGVIHRPGVKGSVPDKANALRSMMDASSVLAKEVVLSISGHDVNLPEFVNDFAINVISEIIATQWAFVGDTDVRDSVFTVLNYIPKLDDVAFEIGQTQWRPRGNIPDREISMVLTISVLKNSEPIFVLLRDNAIDDREIFSTIQGALINTSVDYVKSIASDVPSSVRLEMVLNHLSASSRILRCALQSEISRHHRPEASALKIEWVMDEWREGLQMLNLAVEEKVKIAMNGLMKEIKPRDVEP